MHRVTEYRFFCCWYAFMLLWLSSYSKKVMPDSDFFMSCNFFEKYDSEIKLHNSHYNEDL